MECEYEVGMVAALLGENKEGDDTDSGLFGMSRHISKHFPQCYMENNDKGCIPTTSNKNHDLFLAKKNILHDGFSPPPGVVHETLFDTISTSRLKRKHSSLSRNGAERNRVTEKIASSACTRPRRDRAENMGEERTIFVGNVPLPTTKKMLIRLFRAYGKIKSVRFRCLPVADPNTRKKVVSIKKQFHKERNNVSSYVCFAEEESARRAVELNGHLFNGLHLRVDLSRCTAKHDVKRSVFVGNLPFCVEEESIRQHFEDCGKIENVRVVRDRRTNFGKGFCYILFEARDCVSLAVGLNNSTLQNRAIRVQRCMKRSKITQLMERQKRWQQLSGSAGRRNATNRPASRSSTLGKVDKINTRKGKGQKWRPTNSSSVSCDPAHRREGREKFHKANSQRKLTDTSGTSHSNKGSGGGGGDVCRERRGDVRRIASRSSSGRRKVLGENGSRLKKLRMSLGRGQDGKRKNKFYCQTER